MEQHVLCLKMGVKSRPADVGPVNDLLDGDVVEILLFQQTGEGLVDGFPGLLLASVHGVSFSR